jgi:phage terminase large subunit
MNESEYRNLKLEVTGVFTAVKDFFENENLRIGLFQGGTRSSKTYSICQFLILLALKSEENIRISFVRKSMPALKRSSYLTFIEILQKLDLYDENNHNKTEETYRLQSLTNKSVCTFEFLSCDNADKLRGSERDYLFVDEITELEDDDFFQLNIRTKGKIFAAFNPTETKDHFIYTKLLKSDKTKLHISTFADNRFLTQSLIEEIKSYEFTDFDKWLVYGLGLPARNNQAVIYPNYSIYKEAPDNNNISGRAYGFDVGFTVPCGLTEVIFTDNNRYAYVQQRLYKPQLTNNDILEEFNALKIDKSIPIYVDSAAPQVIEDLKRAGYKSLAARKDVEEGIKKVKSMKLFIDHYSTDLTNEIANYKWARDKNGNIISGEVVKKDDHLLDSMRYAIYTHLEGGGKYTGKYTII